MNIRDLEYICAVADLRHFGKAADKCFVSQPTLSGQIKKLEEFLGVRIFERTNRHVMLTDFGRDIIAHARNVLREVESINSVSQQAQNPLGGRFRLGAFPTLASYVFPGLVKGIKNAMPDLRLVLVEEKTAILIEKLRAGEIDAALLALPVEEEFLDMAELFSDRFLLAVPSGHVLAKYDQVVQADLASYPILLLEEGHCLRDQALDVCKSGGINEEQDFRATSLETLRQMVKAGTAMTFIPEIAALEEDAGICYIPFKPPVPSRTIGLYWRKTSVRKNVTDEIIRIFESGEVG